MIGDEMEARPAECLEGIDLPDGWHIQSRISRHPKSTGGCFSESYKVINSDGREAFLKAFDFSSAFRGPGDLADNLADLSNTFIFERELLNKCKGKSRIVTPITAGYADIQRFAPLHKVPYLIFEMAQSDIRTKVAEWKEFDLAFSLRSIHHSSVGLQQLHLTQIAHQDLKPSNVLYFGQEGSKLSDLGCASDMSMPSKNDKYQIAGDPKYAPPELRYGLSIQDNFHARFIADMYLLGSLIFFFFLGVSASSLLWYKISRDQNRKFTQSTFTQDLPYLQYYFNDCLSDLKTSLDYAAGEIADSILQISRELCEPDPKRRGNPKTFGSLTPQWDLQTYISRFNLLARKAEKKLTL
jgi:serine/threonine protein kinase